jgi:hypothetical protein
MLPWNLALCTVPLRPLIRNSGAVLLALARSLAALSNKHTHKVISLDHKAGNTCLQEIVSIAIVNRAREGFQVQALNDRQVWLPVWLTQGRFPDLRAAVDAILQSGIVLAPLKDPIDIPKYATLIDACRICLIYINRNLRMNCLLLIRSASLSRVLQSSELHIPDGPYISIARLLVMHRVTDAASLFVWMDNCSTLCCLRCR